MKFAYLLLKICVVEGILMLHNTMMQELWRIRVIKNFLQE
jgi:hypothetical protein